MSEPLTFVCWRWKPPLGYRSTFSVETVYALREMVTRHYHQPFRFLCVTDRPDELSCIETITLWDDFADVRSNIGGSYPSCYRRLKVFAPDAGLTFGERLVSIDLDTVIVRDITPLFDRPDDFVIWGEADFRLQGYCGSLWMLKTGTRPQVWTQFNPTASPKLAYRAGARGSDQGWMRYVLGPNEATWTKKDGVYSFRKDISKYSNYALPSDARLIAFHGKTDPWAFRAQQIPWVKQHYPSGVAA